MGAQLADDCALCGFLSRQYHALVSASDNFLRPETLREANDRVSNAIAQLREKSAQMQLVLP